ncbi:hypothetical protein PIIN_06772 [Serendipita indica DSM 11827]|uniref:DUF6533 domain-containing protein n=1 Tax=Serendipita indica (strain DSM 11827) TaxID=1109443 RepID=G4TNE3_SERID|nr:hypothetical protein PIIN_06772 [Serendipita indica DSM 11827]
MATLADLTFFGPLTAKTLQSAAYAVRTARAVNYGAMSLMLWDMLLTLPREVELIWNSQLTALKVIFLFNRYATPAVISVNIWADHAHSFLIDTPLRQGSFAGDGTRPRSESSSSARPWSRALFHSVFGLGTICRRAIYTYSSQYGSLLSLLPWRLSLTRCGFMGEQDIIHIPMFNVCMTKQPVIWTQWLPGVIEHGLYFSLLFYHAMATPRSAHRPALAILYRDGILFYFVTFGVMFTALIIWKYAPRLYMGVTLYTPWIVFQMAISRLLLHVRTSQLFEGYASRRNTSASSCQAPHLRHPTALPLQSFHTAQRMAQHGRTLPFVKRGEYVTSSGHQPRTPSPQTSSQSHGRETQYIEDVGPRWGSNQQLRFWRRRLWWLLPEVWASSEGVRDVYVFIGAESQDCEIGGTGGVRVSRLGRFDHWL